MRKVYSVILKALSTLAVLASFFAVFGVYVKAANPSDYPNYYYWNYKTEKAVVSPYDNYSSNQAAFNKVKWKLLDESQIAEIAYKSGKTDIKLNKDFGSGDVVLGMKTANKELALKAFLNMTFNGKTSPYLQIERLDYYAGTYGPLVIIRCDPSKQMTGSVSSYGPYNNWAGIVYFVETPKNDMKMTFNDNAMFDKATMKSSQYLWINRPHTNISDLYIEGVYARQITGAPNIYNYGSTLDMTISSKSFGTASYQANFIYNRDMTAYAKGQYKKTYGYTSVDVIYNDINKRTISKKRVASFGK